MKRLFSWLRRGGFAILDQGLFAGANFLLTLLLARWLTPEAYGAYALAYSIFILLMAVHTALLTEPMLVFGSGRYMETFRAYLGRVLQGHLAVSLLVSLLLGAVSFGFSLNENSALAAAFLALALASPAILIVWIGRRAFYVLNRPQAAAVGSGVYLVLLGAAIAGLLTADLLNEATAFLAMGLGGIGAGGVLLLLLSPRVRPSNNGPPSSEIIKNHWEYGRWSLGSAGVRWAPGQIYYSILPIFVGLHGSGALRAAYNLLLPMVHVSSALAVLVIPQFVRGLRTEGVEKTHGKGVMLLSLIAGLGLIYALVVVILREKLFYWFYAGQYAEYTDLVILLSILGVISPAMTVYEGMLKAAERPDLVFRAYLAAFIVTVTVGIGLTRIYGAGGAAGGIVAAKAFAAGALAWFAFDRL